MGFPPEELCFIETSSSDEFRIIKPCTVAKTGLLKRNSVPEDGSAKIGCSIEQDVFERGILIELRVSEIGSAEPGDFEAAAYLRTKHTFQNGLSEWDATEIHV
jgi:hypothetical protein